MDYEMEFKVLKYRNDVFWAMDTPGTVPPVCSGWLSAMLPHSWATSPWC